LTLAVAFLAACTGVTSGREAPGEVTGKRPTGHGIRLDVPPGWDRRISKRGFPLAGAVIVWIASFPLPASDDEAVSKAEKAIGRNDVLLGLFETMHGMNLPLQRPRIEPGEERGVSIGRYSVIDHYFVTNGRAFVLHATFGSKPPPKNLIRSVNAILTSFSIARRTRPLRPAPDPAPARALASVRLLATPIRVLNQCQLAQARASFQILCPARLPAPFIGWPRGAPPPVTAERLGKREPIVLSIGYGAPWEPDSGPDWRLHLWRNRPCCFLHFEVFRRQEGPQHVPAGAHPATLGGRRGLLKDATSWGLASREGDYLYWSNHARFLWRENGVPYVATLHRFGTTQETRALLGRLIDELQPVSAFR
jgi:hypothetical protein